MITIIIGLLLLQLIFSPSCLLLLISRRGPSSLEMLDTIVLLLLLLEQEGKSITELQFQLFIRVEWWWW